MAVQTYNPKEVRVTVAGQIVTGYADGTSVVIERGWIIPLSLYCDN